MAKEKGFKVYDKNEVIINFISKNPIGSWIFYKALFTFEKSLNAVLICIKITYILFQILIQDLKL